MDSHHQTPASVETARNELERVVQTSSMNFCIEEYDSTTPYGDEHHIIRVKTETADDPIMAELALQPGLAYSSELITRQVREMIEVVENTVLDLCTTDPYMVKKVGEEEDDSPTIDSPVCELVIDGEASIPVEEMDVEVRPDTWSNETWSEEAVDTICGAGDVGMESVEEQLEDADIDEEEVLDELEEAADQSGDEESDGGRSLLYDSRDR